MEYCAGCGKPTLHVCIHTEERCNHFLHFILSIFTGGLWILIWILAAACAVSSTSDPACTICGSTDTRDPSLSVGTRALRWFTRN
jgi:hypothetical protein